MKLPNGGNAHVDDAKLINYALDPHHPVGGHKARVFRAALGFTQANAHLLKVKRLGAAANETAVQGILTKHGQHHVVDFEVLGSTKTSIIPSVWIVRFGEDFPRLVTCSVLE